MYEYKQILLLRTDLKMRRGKEIAAGAHASLKVVLENMEHPDVKEWLRSAFAKIAVGVDSEAELWQVVNKARAQGIIEATIIDNGSTEFHGKKTLTAAAIGPCHADRLIGITDHLKLR